MVRNIHYPTANLIVSFQVVAKSPPGGHGEGGWGVGLGGGWGLGGLTHAGSNSLGDPSDEGEELPIWSGSSRMGSDPRVRLDPGMGGQEEQLPAEDTIQVRPLSSSETIFYHSINNVTQLV